VQGSGLDDWERFWFLSRTQAIIDATHPAIRPWFGETIDIIDQAQPGDEEEKAENDKRGFHGRSFRVVMRFRNSLTIQPIRRYQAQP